MLPYTNKKDGYICCVHQAHQGTNHITHSVTLGNDESIKGACRAKGCIKVPCLRNGVGADKSLKPGLVVSPDDGVRAGLRVRVEAGAAQVGAQDDVD